MASVYYRSDSAAQNAPDGEKRRQVWWAQFYVPYIGPDGKKAHRQIRRSTGHVSKKKAEAAAAEMERAAQQVIMANTDSAQQAKALLAKAVTDIEQGRFNPLAARKCVADLLKLATGETMPEYTLETWCAEWLRRKKRDASPATMKRYEAHLEAFLDWRGETGRKRPLESVTTAMMRKWREHLQDEGRANKTVLNYIKDVGAVYRAAIREGFTHFNPVPALEALPTDDSMSRKPFTEKEVAALLAAAPSDEWRGLILVAAFTGLRLGDASRLSWSSVDLAGKIITLIPSKTKRKKRVVAIPIQPDLLAYLEGVTILSDQPDAPVFDKLSRARVGTRGGLSQTFTEIMMEAGVDRGKPSRVITEAADGEKKPSSGRVTYERGFHSLRHTFTSWLRNAGVSEEDRMSLTGHSTRDSHAIYSHHDEASLREAVSKLPSLSE